MVFEENNNVELFLQQHWDSIPKVHAFSALEIVAHDSGYIFNLWLAAERRMGNSRRRAFQRSIYEYGHDTIANVGVIPESCCFSEPERFAFDIAECCSDR